MNININPTTIVPLRRDWHVVPHGKLWKLEEEYRAHPWGLYLTQAEAIGDGIEQARLGATSLVVHGRDGTIKKVWSYDGAVIPWR
jgi:hypothetical protein